jgi:hypothetical protein
MSATHFDDGPDGKPQMVLPGAERVTQADIAQRRANAPLKPKTAQQSPGGLWDYEGEQLDLVEMFQDPAED